MHNTHPAHNRVADALDGDTLTLYLIAHRHGFLNRLAVEGLDEWLRASPDHHLTPDRLIRYILADQLALELHQQRTPIGDALRRMYSNGAN